MCQLNSYRPGDSTYEALAPRRPRSIHKIQIKIIYRRGYYRGVWVAGCGAWVAAACASACARQRRGGRALAACGVRRACVLRVLRVRPERARRGRGRLLTHTTRSTTTCMQWSLQVNQIQFHLCSVSYDSWLFCVMLRVVRWGEAFRIYFARSFRFV